MTPSWKNYVICTNNTVLFTICTVRWSPTNNGENLSKRYLQFLQVKKSFDFIRIKLYNSFYMN